MNKEDCFKMKSKDLIFGKINTFLTYKMVNQKTHKGFVDYLSNNLYNEYWYNTPLFNYQNLYVALLPYYKEDEKVKNERGLNRFIIENKYKIKIDYHYILSYMLVYRTKDIYFVECIEVNNLFHFRGVGSLIIDEYLKKYKIFERDKYLLPIEISEEACKFWKKFFEKQYDIYNKKDLKYFEDNLPPHKKYKLKWDFLYDYYDEDLLNFIDKHTKDYNKKYVDR